MEGLLNTQRFPPLPYHSSTTENIKYLGKKHLNKTITAITLPFTGASPYATPQSS